MGKGFGKGKAFGKGFGKGFGMGGRDRGTSFGGVKKHKVRILITFKRQTKNLKCIFSRLQITLQTDECAPCNRSRQTKVKCFNILYFKFQIGSSSAASSKFTANASKKPIVKSSPSKANKQQAKENKTGNSNKNNKKKGAANSPPKPAPKKQPANKTSSAAPKKSMAGKPAPKKGAK